MVQRNHFFGFHIFTMLTWITKCSYYTEWRNEKIKHIHSHLSRHNRHSDKALYEAFWHVPLKTRCMWFNLMRTIHPLYIRDLIQSSHHQVVRFGHSNHSVKIGLLYVSCPRHRSVWVVFWRVPVWINVVQTKRSDCRQWFSVAPLQTRRPNNSPNTSHVSRY